ncbi:MAG: IclR family transcriptional regulator [Nocardioidaceae bacterium]|nr:IclR family transcriptional regulator [Nocardioidaceae bacterium]
MSNNSERGADSTASPVQSVDRALAILEILADAGEAGVTDIGAQLGVHKSTAFRLVGSLEARGLVEQTAERGKYRLGVAILRLAAATTARLDVVQEARPFARRLATDTGETVNVAVLNGGAALYLDQIAGSSALQPHNWVGQRVPLHATSNGKVLLSGLEDDQVRAEVGPDLRAYTPTTVVDVDVLLAEVARVRERGHVVVVDELEHGLTAVAAPVRGVHGDVVASLSVSGPTFRFDAAKLARATELVVAAADDSSRRLGHRPTGRVEQTSSN